MDEITHMRFRESAQTELLPCPACKEMVNFIVVVVQTYRDSDLMDVLLRCPSCTVMTLVEDIPPEGRWRFNVEPMLAEE